MASSEGASDRYVITISLVLHPTTGQSFCYRRPDIFHVLSGGDWEPGTRSTSTCEKNMDREVKKEIVSISNEMYANIQAFGHPLIQ